MPSQAIRFSNPTSTRLLLLLVLAPLAVLALAACGDDPPGAGDPAEQRTGVPAEAIHVLGTSDLVTRIRDLVPGPDGRVWVLNDAPPWFIGFGPDGEVVAAHGERGDGPDEFQAPVALAAVGAGVETGSVWAYDRGRHAMRRIDVGADAGSAVVAFPREEVPPGRLLSLNDVGFGGSRIWLQPYDPEDGVLGYGTEWWRIDPWTDGDEAARIYAVEFPERFTPYRFDHEGVWGVVRDELDVESVAWIELP